MPDCGGPILIVDAEPGSREFVRQLLHADNYATTEITSGEEALATVDELHPALVLLKVELPRLSGYSVCRHLREHFGQQLPIIFVSAKRTKAMDRAAGLLVGADDYITEPFAPDELLARIWRAITRTTDTNDDHRTELRTRLTPRELDILRLLATGLSPKLIAAELCISRKTVATHIQRVLTKLDVHSRTEAVTLAFQSGLINTDTTAHTRGRRA